MVTWPQADAEPAPARRGGAAGGPRVLARRNRHTGTVPLPMLHVRA